MPTTEHIHLPLYTDEETPDLSTTGHYNHAMEIIDANVGELEAEDAELAKDIADERKARTDADTALGSRIDNAEAEISANSADLTGIKGLTYGAQHVNFVESSNGEYSSPALEEIAEQISQGLMVLKITSTTTSVGAEDLAKLKANWPNVILMLPNSLSYAVAAFFYPLSFHEGEYHFVSPVIDFNVCPKEPCSPVTIIMPNGSVVSSHRALSKPNWSYISNKPFSTIGSGLKVVSDALTVDTAAIPTGITANTTFGDLTSGVTA